MSLYYKPKSIKNIIILCITVFLIQKTKAQIVQNDTIFAKKLLQKVDVLAEQKKYTEANKVALQAVTIFQKAKNWNLWYKAYNAIFYNGYYSKNYETSIKLIQKGLQELPATKTLIHGKMFYLLGFSTESIGDLSGALTYYKKSFSHLKKAQHPDLQWINRIQGNIGSIYTQQGDYKKAQEYAKIGIVNATLVNDSHAIWKNTKALGTAYFHAGEFKKAQKTYKKAQQLKDDKDGTYELYEAEILFELEKYQEALNILKKAIRLINICKNNASRNQSLCKYNFNQATILRGKIYLALNQSQQALTQFQKTMSKVKSLNNSRDIGQLYIHIGDALFEQKKYDKALTNYQNALQTFIPSFKENDPSKNPSKNLWTLEIWLMEIFRNKGNCYFNKYQKSKNKDWLHIAAKNYEFAVEISEKVRLNFSETKSKVILGSYTNEFYEEVIKVKLALYNLTKEESYQKEAFQISQRANAFVLRELMNEQQALKAANIPKDTIDLFQEYKKTIAVINRKVENSIDAEASQKQLVNTKEAFQNFKNSISKKYPKFDQLRNDLEGISTTELQKSIQENSLFIKYFLGAKTLYIFSISSQNFYVDQIELPRNFRNQISQYRQSLSDIEFINNTPDIAEKQYLQTANSLYNLLLKTPLQHTKNKDLKEITIVPDGVLHTIPFQALLIQKSDSWTTLDNTVIKKYAIGYQYFCKMMQNKTVSIAAKETFKSFGLELDEYTLNHLKTLTKDSISNATINTNLRGDLVSKLTFSDDEALQLAELMQGKSWVNSAATKANFINHAKNVSSIHLATHSLVNTQNPNFSSLIFTKIQDTINNLLRLDEIYNHNFNSDMITLSACNTGFGKYQKGEGLQSLARAFNFAKIPSVTATLWSIPDASSAKIMKLYYTYLQKGHTKNSALQKAQIEYFQNDEISSPASRLPFYWAAWTHIGDNNNIHFESENHLFYFVLVLLIILVLSDVFVWFRIS